MELRYNCLSLCHKQPFGCVREHESCWMMVEVSKGAHIYCLEAVFTSESGQEFTVPFVRDGKDGGFHQFTAEFTLPCCDLYFYHFRLDIGLGPRSWFRCGETGVSQDHGDRWQITCYPADFHTPDAFAGSVMYQIFPDRFYKGKVCDLTRKLDPYWIHENWEDIPHFWPDEHGEVLNNDFFGGNLDGIRQKLEYLHSLHVEVIYLNPIGMAFSNHRYDTADYKRIDPMLGNAEDFSALCRDAHALGIKIILDGVFSHTGSNSVYFDRKGIFGGGAYSDPSSPYRSWFDFQEYPNRYTSWWGIETLPCVNEMDDAFLDYIIRDEDSVVAHWLKLGADGFRLDVADELPDPFIAMLRARVKELNPDALVLGEVWEDASNKIAYNVRRRYFIDGELDSVMNYPFRTAILDFMKNCDVNQFRRTVMTIVEHYPAPVLHCLMNSLSTHDTPRILTLLGDEFHGTKDEKAHRFLSDEAHYWAVAREISAATLQFTLPGMASIYYGDEAGMQGFEDPLNRRCYPWGKENTELLEYYRKLAGYKSDCKALRTGSIEFLPSPDGIIDFVRYTDNQRIRTIVNGAGQTIEVPLSGKVLLSYFGSQATQQLSLHPWGCAVILENN